MVIIGITAPNVIAEIIDSTVCIGKIEVAYLKEMPQLSEGPFLSILNSTLGERISPFVAKRERDWTSLTPREVETCNLIRSGLSSKDIAQTLHTPEATVHTQRKTIRRKLGPTKSNSNLATCLRQV